MKAAELKHLGDSEIHGGYPRADWVVSESMWEHPHCIMARARTLAIVGYGGVLDSWRPLAPLTAARQRVDKGIVQWRGTH